MDNNDNRIVLLADPETGAIVARLVMPPGQAPPETRAGLERWRRAQAAGAAAGQGEAQEEDEDEEGRACGPGMSLAVVAMLLVFMLGTMCWISAAAEEGKCGSGA